MGGTRGFIISDATICCSSRADFVLSPVGNNRRFAPEKVRPLKYPPVERLSHDVRVG